jgi:tetratricopeptide (TPR) repeat protein
MYPLCVGVVNVKNIFNIIEYSILITLSLLLFITSPTFAELKDFDKGYIKDTKELNAIEWFQKAYSLAKSGNYNEAIKTYNKVIELNPKYVEAYNNRGAVYDNLGNNQQAIRDYKIAAGLGDKDAQDFLMKRGIAW